jgi:AAA15 family ATPase/GTPase
MIRSVKFSNFYSFKEDQEISFLTSKKKAYSYFRSQTKDGQQITKVAGFIGGNASGKTNIMRLFSFFNYFVCEEKRGPNPDVAFKTFFNNKDESKFNIEFEIDGDLYYYNVAIKDNLIMEEKLTEKKNIEYSRAEEIFSRSKNEINFLHEEYFKDFPKNYLNVIRGDVSLIAFLKASHNIEIINRMFNFFSKIYTNINELGAINTPLHNIKSIEAYINDEALKSKAEEFIRRFDIGLEGIAIKKETKSNFENFVSIFGIHKTGKNKLHNLPLEYESRGTRTLLFILAPIFNALKNNGVVILDEIETGLHPEAVKKIVDFFIDENEKGKAQLIFSSHALEFMKKFDMQQIFLTSKDSNGGSIEYRLDKVEDVRPDENFLAKYMSGAYGSFPNIKV